MKHISHQASECRYRQCERDCAIGKLGVLPLEHIKEEKHDPWDQASEEISKKPRDGELLRRIQPVKGRANVVFETPYSLGD